MFEVAEPTSVEAALDSLRHDARALLARPGLPLLHPWANRLSAVHYEAAGRRGRVPDAPFVPRDDHGLAIHGLVAPRGAWTVAEARPERLAAELDFPPDDEQFAAFPFAHRLAVDAAVADGALTVHTTLTATGDAPVPVAFGFHPYFRLPGVPRRAWRVSLPAMRRLHLDLDGIPTGRSQLQEAWSGQLAGLVFDDAYIDVAPGADFVLEAGGRRLTVRFDAGYPVAQVFAPRTEDVICFEPMTAPVDALVSGHGLPFVAPGCEYAAAFSIRVDPA